MAILQECPFCHRKQAIKNRLCSCGGDLVKAKGSKQVKYWVSYWLPGGKQRRELVGTSIQEARDAEGKRRSQKREGRIFEVRGEWKMTFQELTSWYLGLEAVKGKAYYRSLTFYLQNFNEVFGASIVGHLNRTDLENYQVKRKREGKADATVDLEIGAAKTMVLRAIDDDLIGGGCIKPFRKLVNLLKGTRNARSRVLGFDEYLSLIEAAPSHVRPILITAFHTGMRKGELLRLKWDYIDKERRFVRLPAQVTKENRAKVIPINHHVREVLGTVPRALSGYVFTFRGENLVQGFDKSLKTACKVAGISYGMNLEGGFRFHDIRSTVKTNFLRAGVDKAIRDKILGHSLHGMDAYYLNPTDEDLALGMEQYTRWVDDQLSNVSKTLTKEQSKLSLTPISN